MPLGETDNGQGVRFWTSNNYTVVDVKKSGSGPAVATKSGLMYVYVYNLRLELIPRAVSSRELRLARSSRSQFRLHIYVRAVDDMLGLLSHVLYIGLI